MSDEIVIVDYGMGNLYSVAKAVAAVGGSATVTSDPDAVCRASKLILPGVGAFGDCMLNLQAAGMVEPLQEYLQSGKPFLGICLGMQLLFEGSEEAPGIAGLGYFKGNVKRLTTQLKIPHMGWNKLELQAPSPLLRQAGGSFVYFVHSYHVVPADKALITAVCDYGMSVTAAVGKDNVQAVQFHPEKSSSAGLEILREFKEWQL